MSEPQIVAPAVEPKQRRAWRRYAFLIACVAFVFIGAPLAFYIWASSDGAQELVRKRMIALLEESTGGKVQIATFHWNLIDLETDVTGVVLHGREAPTEAPLARIDHLTARLTVFGLVSPRILLRSLDVSQPALHLIVYADGSTNVPQPRKPRKPGKPLLDTIFNLKADNVSVRQGTLDFENRASEFDFQNRFALLAFDAHDVSALVRYVAAQGKTPQTYRIEAGATDLSLSRAAEKPALGSLQATLDLTRSSATLRSLRITSKYPGKKGQKEENHALVLSGVLDDFSHPQWRATTTGELDMRLLEPALGFPFAPQGIARLNLDSAGNANEFRTDGTVHIEDGSYIGTGVTATGLRVDAHVHADPRQLQISRVVAKLRQGGEMEGEVDVSPWLPASSNTVVIQRAGINGVRSTGPLAQRSTVHAPPNPDVISIPVNGKVLAQFKDVSLDTILDIVGQPPFQRLGLDSLINGAAHANWVKGDQNTLVVDSLLNLSPSPASPASEVPSSGVVDATYQQRDGSVDVRKLELHTPASLIEASGRLGAYPLTSSTGLSVDFHSHNLGEFDPLLRDLGLERNGTTGAAALPVRLTGQGQFHGTWAGSLVSPHLTGAAKATQIALEMIAATPASTSSANHPVASSAPKWIQFDSIEANGSYSDERISIQHGVLHHGPAEIGVDGTLDATPPTSHEGEAEFDSNSNLRMHLLAGKVAAGELLALAGESLPLTGSVQADLQTTGPIRNLDVAGKVGLDDATVYGEPVSHLQAQGTLSNQVLRIQTATVGAPAGSIVGSGSFDLKSNQFQIAAKGSGIDIAKIDSLNKQGGEAVGALSFTLNGSGTRADPRLEAHATLNGLTIGGESLGALVFAAHTANRTAVYDATTRLEGAKVDLNGQTALQDNYQTQAKLEFSHFDIGGLLGAAHVHGLTGKSALAGVITLQGPLAHPLQLRGDASLHELEASIAGVKLTSEGGVHATLADGRVSLDPLHITGEDTDLRAHGNMALSGNRRMDFAASGAVNLKLAETIDPDITASGTSTFQVEAHGTLKDPGLQGRVEFQNGSISLEDVPNGLSQLHGTLVFNQNRLDVQSLTALSGGGLLSVGGSLSYQHGIYADLSVTGKSIRIRYPAGISSLADTTLHLQGSQANLLLSGDVVITRFSVSPDLDITALANQANAVQTIAPSDAPSNHIRLDVHVASSPQLNFQNAYAKLAGNVDLRLRGTVATPSLLGRVSITEGSAIIAGTRYDLQRGVVSFNNPVRIEPSIDLNATARVEDYDVTLGLHGTPQKLSVTYRSDPPLPEADVVALLALGRTENQQRLYTQQQEQSAANPTTDALLGGALNATVSSRVQKLFGAGSVKVDPNYIGTLGNSTSRITVEEQLGRNITLTYATDVDTTGQQLLQAEIAINRHVSLLVARDESGVFSMVLKATRRYR